MIYRMIRGFCRVKIILHMQAIPYGVNENLTMDIGLNFNVVNIIHDSHSPDVRSSSLPIVNHSLPGFFYNPSDGDAYSTS